MTDLRTAWTGASALLFDLDGVLTPTAVVHEQAWQELFDGYLAEASHPDGYREGDYFDHIDGKPRFDGVRDFLTSRGITLPEGPADDAPTNETVQGLGNRKNAIFNQIVDTRGVEPYPGSVKFINAALELGLKVSVVSSSRNAPAVLKAAVRKPSTVRKTISCRGKVISRSIWVNSGWRSARRSSSRKQRATWK